MDRRKTQTTTIRLEPADKEAIAHIRELYGCPSGNAAIKLALRLVSKLQFSCETLSHPPTQPITPDPER